MPSFEIIVTGIHVFLYQRTGGAIGKRFFGSDILLLTTTGRKSGKQRTKPLGYLQEGDAYVVVGSNAGGANMPGWFHNLQANPNVFIQVGSKRIPALAEIATGERRDALYQRFKDSADYFSDFEAATERKIPVIIFHPQ